MKAGSLQLTAMSGLGAMLLAVAGPAAAADFISRPLLTADSSWTGLYGGINVGGFTSSGTATWNPLPSPALFGFDAATSNIGTSGAAVGLQAGYNYQLAPAWLVGFEVDASGDHATSSAFSAWTPFGANVPIPGAYTKEIRTLEWLSTARGRFGYLLTPRTLLYFTGGAAFSGVNYAAASSAPTVPGYDSSVSFTDTKLGYVVGGGVEFLTWDRWLVRGEYLYHHFDGASAVGGAANFPAFPSGYTWSSFNIQEFRAALSYKF